MPVNDNSNTDYQHGNVILDIEVTKLDNGMFKARCGNYETNAFESADAVNNLQDQLQQALQSGDFRPEM